MDSSASVSLTQVNDYRFDVAFGDGWPVVRSDEPPPLGQGTGPTPQHFLLAAVANCLSASLNFALAKFKQSAGGLSTTARATTGRNEANRLRVQRIDVKIRLGRPAGEIAHLDRALAQFEDFCTVTQSVRGSIDVRLAVFDSAGQQVR